MTTLFLVLVAIAIWDLVLCLFAPYGYEDETGYNKGKERGE